MAMPNRLPMSRPWLAVTPPAGAVTEMTLPGWMNVFRDQTPFED